MLEQRHLEDSVRSIRLFNMKSQVENNVNCRINAVIASVLVVSISITNIESF